MIARRSLLLFVTGASSQLISLVAMFFMTRYLGADNYGTFAWAIALITVFNAVSDLGTGYAHIKRVSEGQDINVCVSTYAFLKLSLTAVMAGCLGVSLILWQVAIGEDIGKTLVQVLLLLLVYQFALDLSQIAKNTYDARLEISKSQLIALADPLIRVPLVVFVLVIGLDIVHVAYVYAFSGLAVLSISLAVFRRERIKWVKPALLSSYARFAFPVAFGLVAGILLLSVDRLVIGEFWPSSDVAYYSSARSLLAILGTVGGVVAYISFPAFSSLREKGEHESIARRILLAERYISMISLPIVVMSFLYPKTIAVVFFGGEFAKAGTVLGLLSVSILSYQLNQVACAYVLALERPRVLAELTWLQLVLNLALLFLLVPARIGGIELFGLSYLGAAVAYLISMIAATTITRWYIWKSTGIGFSARYGLHFLSAIMTFLCLFGLGTVLHLEGIAALAFFGTLSYALFLGILYLMKEFKAEDFRFLIDLLSVRKMRKYVMMELRGKS